MFYVKGSRNSEIRKGKDKDIKKRRQMSGDFKIGKPAVVMATIMRQQDRGKASKSSWK